MKGRGFDAPDKAPPLRGGVATPGVSVTEMAQPPKEKSPCSDVLPWSVLS